MVVTVAVTRSLGRRPRAAVVDNDEHFRERILMPRLRSLHFDVDGMGNARELYRAMMFCDYEIVLLDLDVPDESGVSIASHLRRTSSRLGIVMLGHQVSMRDQRAGLRAGADAVLAKPVDSELLDETVRNLARWVAQAPVQTKSASGWAMDETGWRIVCPSGQQILLTLVERQVMSRLAASSGAVVSRDNLIATISQDPAEFDPHRLEMLIHRLRKRCLKQCGVELPLHAVRGLGYVLAW